MHQMWDIFTYHGEIIHSVEQFEMLQRLLLNL